MNTYLKETLKENDEILYQVTHVSKSGMSRHIKFYVIRDNELLDSNGVEQENIGK